MSYIDLEIDQRCFTDKEVTSNNISKILNSIPADSLILWYSDLNNNSRTLRIISDNLDLKEPLTFYTNAFGQFDATLITRNFRINKLPTGSYPVSIVLMPKDCSHTSYGTYQGLNESYEYCIDCGTRKT